MKTIPVLVVDTLTMMGLLARPVSAIAVREEEHKSAKISTSIRHSKEYDPDAEFIKISTEISYKQFDYRADIDPWGRKMTESIDASVFCVSPDGQSYAIRKFKSRKALVEALESTHARPEIFNDVEIAPPWKLREAMPIDSSVAAAMREVSDRAYQLLREGVGLEEIKTILREDYFDGQRGGFSQDWFTGADPRGNYGTGADPYQEYIPLMGGPWEKQLYLQQYLEMHAKAFEAYNHNPVAKQIIDLTTSFTLGRGADFTCLNMEVDEVAREFLERVDFFERYETMVTDFWWSGEMLVEFDDDTPSRGLTDFRGMDPSTIWEIVTDPEDIRKVYYAHQQYSTPYQNLYWYQNTGGANGKDIPIMKYVVRHIPADKFIHYKINCSEWEKRGRSDLFCILGWLKRLKDLMNARVVKGILEAAFVWDITVMTGDVDVSTVSSQLPDPYSAGATFVHNKSLELKPQSSSLKSNDNMPDITALTGFIATGGGTPKEFLGVQERGARSNSLTSTEPGTKRYERRQNLEERILHRIMDRVISNAADAGLIDIDEVLQDARSVRRLADPDATEQTRQDVADDMQAGIDQQHAQKQDEQQQQISQQNDQQTAAVTGTPPPPQQQIKTEPPQLALTGATKAKEAMSTIADNKKKKPLNDRQKRRIATIKKTGRYSKELIEWTFPAIAQEDRPQKLKDLALAEAMEWLPKSVTATMAAKELNITTYEFAEAWRTIMAEADAGMSIAHVFGQDNKHVPPVVQAQSVQEETTAMSPPSQQPFTNVPVPPAVAGFKQEPNKNGAPPGQQPNSGDTKINNKLAVKQPNPTDPSHGYSKAANSPFTPEGRSRMTSQQRQSVQAVIYTTLLKEALKPLNSNTTALARYVLQDSRAVEDFEAAVQELVGA